MDEDLSICIVAYRNYEEIIQAIDTLERFTSATIKKTIYIVDNSNEQGDALTQFLDRIREHKDVVFIDAMSNLGFGRGHNYIIDRINSKYHCIMNPDILFCEDAFTPIISYMDTHLDVGMVIPNIVDETGNRQMVYRKEPTVFDMFIRMFCKDLFPNRVADHTLQYENYNEPFQVPFGQGSFLVIRTDLFKQMKGFDDAFFMYMEDADLCKRVNMESSLMYLPDATVIHKWKKGSHKNLNLFKIHVASMKHYFDKWGWKWK